MSSSPQRLAGPGPDRAQGRLAVACLAAAIACGLAGCAQPAAEVQGGAADAAGADVAVVAPIVPALVAAELADGPRVEFEGAWRDDAKRLQVKVFITAFPDLIGIAGHLRFDPAALALTHLEVMPVPAGDPDDAETWEPHAIAKEAPAGRILLGGARFRIVPHVYAQLEGAAVDRELWLVAEFEVKQPGSFKLAFDPASLVAKDATGKDIAVQWGSAEIVWKGANATPDARKPGGAP